MVTLAIRLEEIIHPETRINFASKLAFLLELQAKMTSENKEFQSRETNNYLEEIEAQTRDVRSKTERLAAMWLKKLMESKDQEGVYRERSSSVDRAQVLKKHR